MKILLLSTLKRAVAPDIFASRSRVIYQLAEGLVKRGHTVALLGTGDSYIPGVKIIPVVAKSWTDLPAVENPFLRQMSLLLQQTRMMVDLQDEYDVIHNHTYPDFLPHVVENELKKSLLTTLYAVPDGYVDDVLAHFKKSYFFALSQAYTTYFTKRKIDGVVHAGIDTTLYSFAEKKDDYLFWLGRLPLGKNEDGTFIDPKGVRWAIALAQKTGDKLYLAGAVEDKKFFEQDVKPHLNDKIQWIGDISSEQSLPVEKVVSLMQGAKAFLMTVNQPEPFGLVMAEAMSCGTPVIAFNRGSVPEIIVDGKTGYIVNPEDGVDGLQKAVASLGSIKPQDCRSHVVENFSVEQMVINYEKVYQDSINAQTT